MPCKMYEFTDDSQFSVLLNMLDGRGESDHSRDDAVRDMINAVRSRGDAALVEYTRKFDCPDFERPSRVPEEELARAAASVGADDMDIIARAAASIRAFHEGQKQQSWFMSPEEGGVLGQCVVPVDRAGLYVPGGKGGETPLISSMLMTSIPALVAGVSEVAVVSPPRRDGTLNPYLLAAAYHIGIREVYPVGGAWSIAALAYGTESIPAVDVIAGPGNAWVATAKSLVQGKVGIDMIAGPSEVLVLTDGSANPDWTAADMLSQAEHDPSASAVCVTWDKKFAVKLKERLAARLRDLPRADIAGRALAEWSAVVVVNDESAGMRLANKIAPEHLEVLTRDPWTLLPAIRNAGAVFLGEWSPEPLGDYMAGPNHVLPTMGTARFSQALSVQTFTRRMSVIAASKGFARSRIASVARLARLEQLEAHARSMECRIGTPAE